MRGILVGDAGTLEHAQLTEFASESWYESTILSTDEFSAVHVHHGERAPASHQAVETGSIRYLRHGIIRQCSYDSEKELATELLDSPESVLPKLDGSFLLCVFDDDDLVIATDRLASKRLYTSTDPFIASSSLAALARHQTDPEIDPKTVGDLLTFGYAWNDNSLIKSVDTMPIASYIEASNQVPRRYSSYVSRESNGSQSFVDNVALEYRNAVQSCTDSVEAGDHMGMWLSGGLDSRFAAKELSRSRKNIRTFTYDGNPADGTNVEPAKRIAAKLNIDHEICEFTPNGTAEYLDKAALLTDGMKTWRYIHGVDYIFNDLSDNVDVMLDISGQGEVFGDDIFSETLQQSNKADLVDSLYHDLAAFDANKILKTPYSGRQTTAKAIDNAVGNTVYETGSDVIYANYFRNHYRGDLVGSQVDTRSPLTSRALLERTAALPPKLRQHYFPMTGGKIPQPVAPLKLKLARRTDSLSDIKYERTNLQPKWPQPIQLLGAAYVKLRHDRYGTKANWYRSNTTLRRTVDDRLANMTELDFINKHAVAQLQDEVLSGDDDALHPIAVLSSIGSWHQQVM
ncbi:asparagine synthase-related protein [Natrinema gelatinilyticum]|uniref:asparagine synthase-related protein n=1 Tax=Natrinema gelatinilyticum TaxID=2961571 RepID=UPI0020C5AC8B|nr:asparagine synthase-related protein [Natrinema gelatinilyticum]